MTTPRKLTIATAVLLTGAALLWRYSGSEPRVVVRVLSYENGTAVVEITNCGRRAVDYVCFAGVVGNLTNNVELSGNIHFAHTGTLNANQWRQLEGPLNGRETLMIVKYWRPRPDLSLIRAWWLMLMAKLGFDEEERILQTYIDLPPPKTPLP